MGKLTITYRDIAPGASEAASFQSGSVTDFSDVGTLRQENDTQPISTLELNGWPLDGKHIIYSGQRVPFWSNTLSGPDCVFASPPVLDIAFPEQFSSLGVTLVFDSGIGNFCGKLNIKWYQQSALKDNADFEPNANIYFCKRRVEAYDRIVITFLETWLPYQWVKLQQVIFGIIRSYGMSEIRNAKVTNQTNLISTEIPISTLNWTLDSREDVDYMFQLKQEIDVQNDDFFIGAYYINEHKRTAKNVYDLRCQDAIGILNDDTFPGGVYTNYSAKQLLQDIIGGAFDVDFGTVADTNLTGVILPASRRAAIQQVAFAWGVCVATDGGNAIRVFRPSDVSEDIGAGRTYTGATVETAAIVTAVRVTAHTYTQNASGNIEINGVKYQDTTTVYTATNPNVTASDKQNVKEITGATLVSPAIGQATAQRVYDYYTRRNTAKGKIVWKGELLGDSVTLPNAWDEPSTGNISKMDYVLSNTVAASLEVVS